MPEKTYGEQIMIEMKRLDRKAYRRFRESAGSSILMAALIMPMLAACAFTGGESSGSSVIDRAQRDHALCREEGHSFPSREYTWCRQALQDERERRALRGRALVEQDNSGIGVDDPLFRPTTRRGDFRCEQRRTRDIQWIDCRVHEER